MSSSAEYSSLRNKHVFITGGATGIGAALVTAFVEQGAKVVFVDIDKNSGEQLAKLLSTRIETKSSANPEFKFCDVTDISSLQQVIESAGVNHGNIDVLINNVANDQRFDATKITPQQWHQSMAVNLDPAFFAAQAVQPMMKQNGGGSIINFSSINAKFGPKDMPSYITAKAALLGMSKSLARDFGEQNIRVNTILPGWVVTEKQLQKWLTAEAEEEWMEQVCLKKRIKPSDVANLALFLASDNAAMITSQEFVIDGGRI